MEWREQFNEKKKREVCMWHDNVKMKMKDPHCEYSPVVLQMIWFRENWYEELLRQLNEGLVLCQSAAFENMSDSKCT